MILEEKKTKNKSVFHATRMATRQMIPVIPAPFLLIQIKS